MFKGCVAIDSVKDHTFSKVTHTEDINQTDKDADDYSVNRNMFCLKKLVEQAGENDIIIAYVRIPEWEEDNGGRDFRWKGDAGIKLQIELVS